MSDVTPAPAAEAWTVGRLLAWTKAHFAQRGLDQPRLCAELLLAHAMECDKLALYTRHDAEPTPGQRDRFRELVRRAAKREPIAYLVGQREFFSLRIAVRPGVLIPRPETEHLVEQALDVLGIPTSTGKKRLSKEFEAFAKLMAPPEPPPGDPTAGGDAPPAQASAALDSVAPAPTPTSPAVWDLCCGSGCVGVAIAHRAQAAGLGIRVLSSDLSPTAVAVTQENAAACGVSHQVTALRADLLDLPADAAPAGGFRLIACNPPYVAQAQRAELDPELSYEPAEALFGGDDGLAFYRRLAYADKWLEPEGWLLLEVGAGQSAEVSSLLGQRGWAERRCVKDLLGHERVLGFQRA